MYFLGLLCLLSAAVALPTPEQLHTNLAELPPPPELKSEDSNNISDEQVVVDSISTPLDEPVFTPNDKSEEVKNPSESAEKPKAEKDDDKDKLDDVIKVIKKESKESKESKHSKEKSKESKEPWESKEFEPEEHKEENKEKDSKFEESKEGDEEVGPIIVQVIKKPSQKGFISDWLPFPNFHLPWPFSWRGQPVYIVRESDFAFDDV